jgi:hypothetical protein
MLTLRLLSARKRAAAAPAALTSSATRSARRRAPAAVHSCTVLQVGAAARHLWQFHARTAGFALNREHVSPTGQALPAGLVAKDWRSLFQRKLNIAWLPPEQVFLRVAQFPASDYAETVAMVELQLERLSPMPVTQIVWSLYVLPQARDGEQTVVVLIVARNVVEEFLGQLETQGFLPDRLEVPALDQLQATAVTRDGTWIYPGSAGVNHAALVAWWYGGALRNLDLLTLPPNHPAESLREQLTQTAWSGELEGWLTTTPRWHLVADPAAAPEWESALRTALDEPIEVSSPVPAPQLAAQTANRATRAEAQANLLPVEFATRYRQQFVDRLWMGGLVGVVGLYLAGVAVYLVALEVLSVRTRGVEDQVAALSQSYTNALQVKARYEVLKDRQELKYAALDCWRACAELVPAGLTLESLNFSEGKHISLSGAAPKDQTKELLNFASAAHKYTKDGELLFDPSKVEIPTWNPEGPETVRWSVTFELRRGEAP